MKTYDTIKQQQHPEDKEIDELAEYFTQMEKRIERLEKLWDLAKVRLSRIETIGLPHKITPFE